jgi:O-antigen/teichoic acid export membrane protein
VTSSTERPASIRHRGAAVAIAMAVTNVATYLYTALAARLLGPKDYGALASLMAVLLVVSVIQLGIQTTAARRISADPGHVGQIEREILSLTYRGAVLIGLGLLLLTPVIDRLLKLESLATASMVAFAAVPLTISGGQLGILQGERRWWPVSAIYVASGVPRLVVGTALILWRPNELTAMLGVVSGLVVPVLLGLNARRPTRAPGRVSEHHSTRPIVREILVNSQALLAFLTLSNCDVIVARNILGEHDAGLYAGGLILTKAMLFLPQFVVVVAFPSMSTAHERRRALFRGLTLIFGLGTVGVLGCAALPQLALIFVGGAEYAEIEDRLWLFATLGTVLSLLQLLIYAVLARQGTRSVYLVWVALAAVLVIGWQATSLWGLLMVVIVVDSVLFLALLAISLRRLQLPVPSGEPPPETVV